MCYADLDWVCFIEGGGLNVGRGVAGFPYLVLWRQGVGGDGGGKTGRVF